MMFNRRAVLDVLLTKHDYYCNVLGDRIACSRTHREGLGLEHTVGEKK
jgi:hypothetical protein